MLDLKGDNICCIFLPSKKKNHIVIYKHFETNSKYKVLIYNPRVSHLSLVSSMAIH